MHHHFNNIIALIDVNGIQAEGKIGFQSYWTAGITGLKLTGQSCYKTVGDVLIIFTGRMTMRCTNAAGVLEKDNLHMTALYVPTIKTLDKLDLIHGQAAGFKIANLQIFRVSSCPYAFVIPY